MLTFLVKSADSLSSSYSNHISGWELTVEIYNVKIFIYQEPPTKVICFPEDNCFKWCFAHSQFKSIELRMSETLPETIVFKEANYLSWRLLINENFDSYSNVLMRPS